MNSGLIVDLQQVLPSDRLFTDPVDCYAYAYDNSRNYHAPVAVVFPLHIEAVSYTHLDVYKRQMYDKRSKSWVNNRITSCLT